MVNIIALILIIPTLIINIFAVNISIYVTIYLICHLYRSHELNALLVINTYMPVFLASFAHAVWNIRAILNDTLPLISDDSAICHVWGYVYLYVIMWLFGSFSVQAYIRMLNIMYPNRTYLHSFMIILIFIVSTWFVTLLLLIPTIFFDAITYQTSEYQCVVDLRTWKGNVYMMLMFYSIPITITATAYLRVMRYIKASTLRTQPNRRSPLMRDARVLQHTVILVCALIILGLPSAILWIQGLITGYLHPLTYRIQGIFIAMTMLILAIAIPLTNPQVKRLLPLFHKPNAVRVVLNQVPQQLTT